MAIEHDAIADSERHEPKGVSTATNNEVYLADGLGSGVWAHPNPHGGWRYSNIGTGTTFTTPTAYTLMDIVGGTTHLHEFTNNGLGRLTYTGTLDRHCHLVMDTTFKHSTGSGQDVFFEVYKNGAAQSAENVATADSANYQHLALHFDDILSTNDYLEIYIKTVTGNVVIHGAYMFVMGMPD